MISCFQNQESPQQFKSAVQNFGIAFPALLNPNNEISNLYGVDAVPTLFFVGTDQKICDMHIGAGGDPSELFEQIRTTLINGGACTKNIKLDIHRWAAAVTILFGVIQGGGGLALTPGGKPIPIDPDGPLTSMSADKRNILMNLAISELTKSLHDATAAAEIHKAALRSAESSRRNLLAKATAKTDLPSGSISKKK